MRLASTLATHELSRMQGVCEFSRLSPTVRAGILPQLMLGALSFSLRTLVLLLALASPSIAEAQFSDVELKLLRYGAGNVARVGDPVGLLVEVKNSLDEPTEVELVWETRNADGDIEEQSRNFVLNPGQPIERWVYGTTPIARNISDASSVITTLRVFSLKGGRRETELASLPISAESAETPGLAISTSVDLLGVLGPQTLGLNAYATNYDGRNSPAHNSLAIIARFGAVDDLPDRWYGFAALDALVWCDPSAAPARLSTDQSEALIDWIERGGHLIIALNANGDPWDLGGAGRHALQPLLPSVAPTRIEAVRVDAILPVLSLSTRNNAPNATTRIAVFDPATLDRQWRPLLAFPSKKAASGFAVPREGSLDAQVYGVERVYGFGTITLIGLDLYELSARRLQSDTSLPQGDVFWNRILARRGDTPNAGELKELEEAKRLSKGGVSSDLGGGGLIANRIGLIGAAAMGVLAAAGTFSVYWLLAGPLGFAILKSLRHVRAAWVYSALLSLLFAIGIWLVGSTVSGSAPRVKYLMFLDAAARPQGETSLLQRQPVRASGWLSMHVPAYASSALQVGTKEDGRTLLRSWLNPSDPTIEGFPSQARVARPIDAGGSMDLVSRAASTDLSFRWLGGIDAAWGALPSVASEVRVDIDRTKSPLDVRIVGTLVHELPQPLRNVMLIHIWPLRSAPVRLRDPNSSIRTPSGAMPNFGSSVTLTEWRAHEPLDLAKAFAPSPGREENPLEKQFDFRYYDSVRNLASPFSNFGVLKITTAEEERFLQMLSFFSMLEPPKYMHAPDAEAKMLTVERLLARDADLSKWFTRPCLIVYGLLEDSGSPIPITVDGDAVDSSGQIVLRWILPLPSSTDTQDIVPRLRADQASESPSDVEPTEADAVQQEDTEPQ